jgi:hypothetical protein
MRRLRSLLIATLVCSASAFTLASEASANSPRVTRGDAVAVFDALESGVRSSPNGAPAQWPDVGINFLNPNQRFCSVDWHTIMLAFLDGGNWSDYTPNQAKAVLSQSSIAFVLDGAPLSIETTAIKRATNPEVYGVDFLFWQNWGTLMPPESLSVGTHQIQITAAFFGFPTEVIDQTFVIDGPGTGACL